jgi:hypothetical protein
MTKHDISPFLKMNGWFILVCSVRQPVSVRWSGLNATLLKWKSDDQKNTTKTLQSISNNQKNRGAPLGVMALYAPCLDRGFLSA